MFFIAFTKTCQIEPMVSEFAYMFTIKALKKHMEFCYTTSQGVDVRGLGTSIAIWTNGRMNFSFTFLDVQESSGLHVSGD